MRLLLHKWSVKIFVDEEVPQCEDLVGSTEHDDKALYYSDRDDALGLMGTQVDQSIFDLTFLPLTLGWLCHKTAHAASGLVNIPQMLLPLKLLRNLNLSQAFLEVFFCVKIDQKNIFFMWFTGRNELNTEIVKLI